jgi:uncharacterized protein
VFENVIIPVVKRTILIFLTVVFVFLFLTNFVVYEALLLALGVGSSLLAVAVLGILSVSFIVSILVGMRHYNYLTRAYYTIAMIWMGFLGYFFIVSVLYIPEFAYIGDASKLTAFILFGLSILVGIYGIFHARKLITKEITTELPNTPAEWKGRKAVLICDLHIGQINGKNFVEKVVGKLKAISPDIIFIGGDLFDGSSATKILDSVMPFREINSPLGIFFVTGNHETYGNSDLFLKVVSEANIRTLRDEKVVIDGLQIIGVDYKSTAKEDAFKKVLADMHIDRNMPSILLKHEPRHIEIAEKAGISMHMSGHTHRAQQWPFEYFARLAYGRFTYGLNRFGNMQTYTSSGVGTWGPPLRVGTDSEIVIFNFK